MPEIILLATAHHYHLQWPHYSYQVLGDIIGAIRPAVICVELDIAQLAARGSYEQPEYKEAILPKAGELGCKLFPIKPIGERPVNIEEVGVNPESLFGSIGLRLYSYCLSTYIAWDYHQLCKSLKGIQSDHMDGLMRRKWLFAKMLLPERWRLWEAWNRKMASAIAAAISDYPDSTILITVGLEHKYWLKERLAKIPGVRLKQFSDIGFTG